MVQPAPALDWLDEAFLSKCLQKERGKEEIVITNFKVSPAVPAGNNYGSIIVRVNVDYKMFKDDQEVHSISLIVKSELTHGVIKQILDSAEPKEPVFYKTFLPIASKITNVDFVPRTLFSPKESVIVLEDLRDKGFLMADRTKKVDFEHCRLYLEAAASLHAVSFAVHKQHPELVESLGEQLDVPKGSDADAIFKNIIKTALECFINATRRIERFKKHCKTLENLTDKLYDMVTECTKCKVGEDTINTLCQGDPWITNMMFKYDEDGVVREIKLLDFQGLKYTTPVSDVMFFIWSSANHDLKKNRLNDLYRLYLDSLNKKLIQLDCTESLTFDDFMVNKKRMSPFVAYNVIAAIPFMFDSDPVDFAVFSPSDKNPFEKYYDFDDSNSFCNKHLPHLLEALESAGVFDDLSNYNR